MSRLFLRVFLWFWLGSTVLLLVLAVSLTLAQPGVITTWRFIGRTAMQYAGAHVADVYESDGASAAATAIANVGRGRFRVWLYDGGGRFVAGPGLVANAADVIARAPARDDDAERILNRDAAILAERIKSTSGADYVVMWEGSQPLRWLGQLSPMRFTARLGALILASGICCWLLTWQITKPIATLGAAARRLADGDLAVRVGGNRELQRGDELADLAKEFDAMAARIQELIKSQQQLLADISHELRSPLARLSLALDLARRRLGDQVPEHDRIDQEIRRLDGLIGQLLLLARMQSHTSSPQFERVSLRDLVREVAQDARFEAESSGRTVTLEGDVEVSIHGNRALLRSAVENVVRNAIRYAPEGSAVSIAMESKSDAGPAAIIIGDRGPGVPAQALTRLFDPFFRVDDARDRTSGGAGLGLAITRQAMIAHGGSVTAHNRPDGGLIVRLELPVQARG